MKPPSWKGVCNVSTRSVSRGCSLLAVLGRLQPDGRELATTPPAFRTPSRGPSLIPSSDTGALRRSPAAWEHQGGVPETGFPGHPCVSCQREAQSPGQCTAVRLGGWGHGSSRVPWQGSAHDRRSSHSRREALMTLHAACTLESCPWGLGSSEHARPGCRLRGWQQ